MENASVFCHPNKNHIHPSIPLLAEKKNPKHQEGDPRLALREGSYWRYVGPSGTAEVRIFGG